MFYIGGIIYTVLDPTNAPIFFKGGFLLGNLEVKIQYPSKITLNYFYEQFINFLGKKSFNIFLNNLLIIIISIFSGIGLITVVCIGLFSFSGSITYMLFIKFGLIRTIIIFPGLFHLYLELLAGFLAIDAFVVFYGSFYKAIINNSLLNFKINIKEKFIPLILRITSLLLLAAFLEVFWSTWWVFIVTNQYIPWHYFYTGIYSAKVIC
ncbi:MAG: stage II sporulation protein M [Methanobacteriaceae archaeon]|nr:stage II sporulation protein M [Methanobacteriaceae archaeon]